jgi:acyl carrier protein
MSRTELLAALAVILNHQDLAPELPLSAIPTWDSVAVVEFQALADDQLHLEVVPDQLASCRTVADLISLVAAGLKD